MNNMKIFAAEYKLSLILLCDPEWRQWNWEPQKGEWDFFFVWLECVWLFLWAYAL